MLIQALEALGFKPENHIGKPQNLTGYRGDKRKDVADIIIPRKQVGGASNDIGFVRGSDGKYSAIISEYDSTAYNSQWMNGLKVKYAEKGVIRQAKRAGLKQVGQPKIVNGKLQYQFLKA